MVLQTDYQETGMDSPDESVTLISAGKVQGTPVYSERAERLGEIYDVMLEKRTGRIAYAILTFGGILGMGKKYVPLPWNLLSYDVAECGYIISVPKEALENGPTLNEQAEWHADVGRMIETYYEIHAKTR
jgi:sporulation protein YlmC with PRC-barrel domain